MKTLAAIKNELFKDYIKVVSTDNLEATLDNPAVPVPFVCVSAIENTNADALAVEINKFFEHRKLKNKDFLVVNEEELTQLGFLFNLIQISSGGKAMQALPEAKPVEKAEVSESKPVEAVSETSKQEVTALDEEATPEESAALKVAESTETETKVEIEISSDGDMIESLNIPKNSTIHFFKDDSVTATLLDEKNVIFEGEEVSVIDAARKALKKTGAGGMATGLANWNYNGKSLKSYKEKTN